MTKLEELKKQLAEKTPKQMRTLRNQLNNRITSFKQELDYGKKLAKISESHVLFGLGLKECNELLEAAKKQLKNLSQDNEKK